MKIKNPWNNSINRKDFYDVNELIYENGDFRIFKQFDRCYLYTYKNTAIHQLGGIDKEYIDNLAEKTRPESSYKQFLYNRAMNIIKEENK